MKDSDELELQVNADEMCRTCLGQFPTGQLKPIFCNEILDGKIISFPKVLESTVGIKPAKNEVFPKNVCVDCKSKLKELFSFREKTTKSFDLLYEIFGIEKPPVSQPLKKELSAAGTQTCQLIINEEDLETCHQYLTITRAAKPTTSDAACQAGPKTEESPCQTESLAVTKKDASTQIDHPSLQNFEISPVEEETGSQTNETLYVEETTEMDDDNFSQVDVIDDMGAADNIVDDTDLELDDNEMPALLEQDEFNFVEKSSDKSDNHDKAEQGIEHETIEYLTYEVIREEEEEPETEVKSSRSFKEVTSKVGIEKKCNYCQFVSSVKSAFNDHYAIHEQTIETIFDRVDYYRCTNCKVVYPTLSKLQDHVTTEECNAIDREDFEESSDAIVHEQFYNVGLDICLPRMKTFHLNERSQVVCGFCSLAFETWSDALEHYSSIHENEETSAEDVSRIWNTYGYDRIHRCGICKDQFADASFIRQHVYFHRSRYDCPYDCSGTFRDFFKLTVHLNQNHLCKKTGLVADAKVLPSQPDMVCQICFKRFTSETSYKVHTKNHFANRRYTCTECPKAFLQKCDLTIHMRSHTDERPFACTVPGCDKKFRTSSHRRDHMSTHAEEKKYQCDICLKHFKAERILQGHIRLHSGFRPFDCSECGKTFSRKHHVKLHMKTHGKNVKFE